MAELQLQQSTPAETMDTAADLELQHSESPVDRDIGWKEITVLKKGMTHSYTVLSTTSGSNITINMWHELQTETAKL